MKIQKCAAIILLIFFCIAIPSYTLETGFSFHIGNFEFAQDRQPTESGFPGTVFPWGINVYALSNLSNEMSMETGYNSDPVLRNSVYARLNIKKELFSLGIGPFFGVFNSGSTLMKSGISTSARIEFPGLFFITFKSDNTLGGQLIAVGDYSQEQNTISIGYYVKNAICSLNLETKRFSMHTASGDNSDSFTEYSFKTDLYKKNVPYNLLLTFAYQQRDKVFLTEEEPVYHTLGSIVVGITVKTKIGRVLELFADVENCVYAFGQNALLGLTSDPLTYYFNASVGFTLNTDGLKPANEI